MKASIKQETFIRLDLSIDEALALQAIVQNPPNGQESPEEYLFYTELFHTLKHETYKALNRIPDQEPT